ncbi:MAG: thioredoxin family protein, partial [Chitinophagaceae bacterium]|nr:thioredoxin family protein [Chitinophagaceae bacterium]
LAMVISVWAQQNKGISFEHGISWQQVKAKAKAEKKFIFIDVFATWCGPCKWMDGNTYTTEKAGIFMNDRFINVKVQADSSKNDNEEVKSWYATSRQFMNEYKINAFPNFLYFDPNGKLVHQFSGVLDDSMLIVISKNALNPGKQYYTLEERYKKGKLEYAEMPYLAKSASYLNNIAFAKEVADNYINNYLFTLKKDDLFTADNLAFIARFLGDKDSRSFKLFSQNTSEVNAILGADQAQYAMKSFIAKNYIPGEQEQKATKPNWDVLEKTITATFGAIGQETVYGYRMLYHMDKKEWEAFGKYYVSYFQLALKRPDFDVNNLSWPLFENVTDKKVLEYACVVMKYAMENWYQTNAPAYDTYANLLYKAGKKSEAIEWQEKAVKMAKGTPYEKENIEHLVRMRNDQPTWPVAGK